MSLSTPCIQSSFLASGVSHAFSSSPIAVVRPADNYVQIDYTILSYERHSISKLYSQSRRRRVCDHDARATTPEQKSLQVLQFSLDVISYPTVPHTKNQRSHTFPVPTPEKWISVSNSHRASVLEHDLGTFTLTDCRAR